MNAIAARYAGTCAVTGRDYERGAMITKSRVGWALDDQLTRDTLTIRESAPIRLITGEGYGGTPYTVGEVVRDGWWDSSVFPQVRHEGLVLIQAASAIYCDGDGMDHSVGDDYGYLYQAWGRKATDEEAASLLAREATARERQRQAARVREIALQIARDGHYPDPTTGSIALVGERLLDTQDLYGGGEWFVIDEAGVGPQGAPAIWYVRNNGSDGADWSRNNVRTGGAGAIGHWVAYDAALADELRDLHQLRAANTGS